MTRFGHKLNYVINTFVKHTPGTGAPAPELVLSKLLKARLICQLFAKYRSADLAMALRN